MIDEDLFGGLPTLTFPNRLVQTTKANTRVKPESAVLSGQRVKSVRAFDASLYSGLFETWSELKGEIALTFRIPFLGGGGPSAFAS